MAIRINGLTKKEALKIALDERIKKCNECWATSRYHLDQSELAMILNDKAWDDYIKKIDKINEKYSYEK